MQISSDVDFKNLVLEEKVKAGVTSFAIPDGEMEKGTRYFWRVLAECGPGSPECPSKQTVAANGSPFSFSTAFNVFERLESAGFSLQRAIAGVDATEGAQFSFLASAERQTIFTADFALVRGGVPTGMREKVDTRISGVAV